MNNIEVTEFDNFLCQVAKNVAKFNIKENINNLSEAFDMWYAGLLAGKHFLSTTYQNIDQVKDSKFDNDQLLSITKAGSYIRYAADNSSLISADPDTDAFMYEFLEIIDKKNKEDTPSETAMEEVENLINETEEILDNIEEQNQEEESED